jgi:hypothetical protein
VRRVADGRPLQISQEICSCEDLENGGAPLYRDGESLSIGKALSGSTDFSADRVKWFLRIKADISELPVETFTIERGGDNRDYYVIDYEIEVHIRNEHTNFMIFYNGKRYNNVDLPPVFA